jgi:hypothetical protein
MWIIGCDFHSGFQQLAIFDNQTGEIEEKKLLHPAPATEFYRGLQGKCGWGWSRDVPATGCGSCCSSAGTSWIGDAARIRAAETQQHHLQGASDYIFSLRLITPAMATTPGPNSDSPPALQAAEKHNPWQTRL